MSTGSASERITAAAEATSSTVSPLTRSAARKAPTWAGVALARHQLAHRGRHLALGEVVTIEQPPYRCLDTRHAAVSLT